MPDLGFFEWRFWHLIYRLALHGNSVFIEELNSMSIAVQDRYGKDFELLEKIARPSILAITERWDASFSRRVIGDNRLKVTNGTDSAVKKSREKDAQTTGYRTGRRPPAKPLKSPNKSPEKSKSPAKSSRKSHARTESIDSEIAALANLPQNQLLTPNSTQGTSNLGKRKRHVGDSSDSGSSSQNESSDEGDEDKPGQKENRQQGENGSDRGDSVHDGNSKHEDEDVESSTEKSENSQQDDNESKQPPRNPTSGKSGSSNRRTEIGAGKNSRQGSSQRQSRKESRSTGTRLKHGVFSLKILDVSKKPDLIPSSEEAYVKMKVYDRISRSYKEEVVGLPLWEGKESFVSVVSFQLTSDDG